MIRRLAAEALGTGLLLMAVVGSGIMAERLSGGNTGVALLANTIATGAALYWLITILGPVSGASFNPVVTLIAAAASRQPAGEAAATVAAQVAGGVLGVWLTHAQFGLPIWQQSDRLRDGPGQGLSEVIATFGLILVIEGGQRVAADRLPALVALYITGAYWFTASTSFANPAATLARSLSDTFAGIAPSSVPVFLGAQLIGGALGFLAARALFGRDR